GHALRRNRGGRHERERGGEPAGPAAALDASRGAPGGRRRRGRGRPGGAALAAAARRGDGARRPGGGRGRSPRPGAAGRARASLGQAGVAQRLAGRKALVRRLSAVEALGRVDVACVDKTGTLTENRLSLQAVVAPDGSRGSSGQLSAPLRDVLRCAAFASPPPGSSSAAAHATDVAVLEAARRAGLDAGLDDLRAGETPFDAVRPFHATLLKGRLCVKGSVEEVSDRCSGVRLGDAEAELDASGRNELLERARLLAEEGLRVLLV